MFETFCALSLSDAGVLKGLQDQQQDLNRHHFIGSSGGALLATLAAAEVEPTKAIELALHLTEEAGEEGDLKLTEAWGGLAGTGDGRSRFYGAGNYGTAGFVLKCRFKSSSLMQTGVKGSYKDMLVGKLCMQVKGVGRGIGVSIV